MVGPKRPDATVCWCLSYRIPSKQNVQVRGTERGAFVEQFVRQIPPPGVLAYDGDEVVGWAGLIDLTMAYVGTQKLVERAGFTRAADTDSVIKGFPRVLMRLELR